MIPAKTFLFFLLDTPTGKAYYRDSSNNTQLVNIATSAVPVDLPHAPGNWMECALSFDRNMTYFGLNRSYSTPQDFVLEAKSMIEELTLLGVGVEIPLSLAIFKLNTQPLAGEPTYKLLYKAPIDLPEAIVTVFETLTCNLMEGGVSQLLKNYESTPLTIPCDGSLPDHIKANYDGMLVEDKLHYQFVPFTNSSAFASTLATVYLDNEGGSFGVVHNDQSYSDTSSVGNPANFFIETPNWTIYFNQTRTVRLKGYIVVNYSSTLTTSTPFTMYLKTNANPAFVRYITPIGNIVDKETRYDFDETVTLQPFEKLIFAFSDVSVISRTSIVGGSFSIAFSSKPHDSRAWGLTAYDLWRLIGKKICLLASTTAHPISYDFTSTLLQQYLNFFMTSGDALRASNDPTYQRYFFIDETNTTDFGPVIKITLKQFYESIRVPLMASVGRASDPISGADKLFFETLQHVFDSSIINYSLGEVSKFKYDLHSKDFRFSDLSIGYPPQTYDQKAGKYEWNTRLKMKAPIKSFSKALTLESFIRWDVYGIERLRAGAEVGASTSTTRNDSDNSVFGTVIDRNAFIYDYFRAVFISLISNPDDANNTNIHFATSQGYQKFDMPITDGEYFSVNKDFGIFVFAAANVTPEACNLTISGLVNSINKPPLQPADKITITLYHNGVNIFQSITTVAGVNTPITINHNFTELFQYGDSVYIAINTTATGEAMISTATLTIGSRVTMSGANIPVLGGTSQQLLSMPTVVPQSDPFINGTSIVQSGFQYFQYNSLAYSNNFNVDLGLTGCYEGQVANFEFDVWVNGVRAGQIIFPGSVSRVTFAQSLAAIINRNFQLNDIIFVTGSNNGSALSMQLFTSTLIVTSTYVKCYNLYRIQYDNMQGLPLLVTDINGNFRTDQPGCPYNIEYVSPARCLEKWMPFINSNFVDNVTGDMIFQTLDKNSYLSTSVGAVTVTENANKPLLNGGRLFYPIPVEFTFYCPLTFAEQQSLLANGHLHLTYFGKDFYIHLLHIEQRPALNDTTFARGLLSPLVNLADLANISAFKLPDMNANSIKYSFLNPIQFIPINQTVDPKYKTLNRNEFFFKDQITRWVEQSGYAQPVQVKDILTLQFITRDLDPITYTVYKCDGTIYINATNLDTIPTNSLNVPGQTLILWQKYIDTTSWAEGAYYIVISSTVGDQMISELLDVRNDWPNTVYVEATSSQNVQQTVFISDVPFVARMRIAAMFDNQFKQMYAGKFYTDQTQDSTILNAIPYEETEIYTELIPDYAAKKLLRLMALDNVTLDGEGYSIVEGAELEPVFTIGAPKKFNKLKIRPKTNLFSIDVEAGVTDRDVALMIVLDQVALGPNQTNSSGSTSPVLIDVPVNP